MWTLRKACLATAAVLSILFLLRSSISSSSAPAPILSDTLRTPPSRSYPPPSTQKKPLAGAPIVSEIAKLPLRARLKYQFPYDLEQKFPAYIWQTWKMGPSSAGFSEKLRPLEASWSQKHPGFVHEVVSDKAAVHLISYLYASLPEVVEAYNALPEAVLKADFFRYLILLARGGIYSDIDTEVLKPASDWIPDDFDRSTAGLIVGIEADVGDRVDWELWYSRRIQFCQWTIQAKPGHPVLRDIVATITEDTLRMKKDRLLKPGDLPKSIVEFTGPAVWTDAIFSYFNNPTFFDFTGRSTNVSFADFSGITEQKKIGDVVVLPITCFSPGVRQMGAHDVGDRMAFVRHEFEGMSSIHTWIYSRIDIEQVLGKPRMVGFTWKDKQKSLSIYDFVHALRATGAYLYNKVSDEPNDEAGSVVDTFDDSVYQYRPLLFWSGIGD